jgi:hypothetical protein
MAASSSSSWHWFRAMDRAYWLPPGGIGNGLNAQTWAVLVDADASILMLLLDTLREADIPAHAVRLDLLGRRSPASIGGGLIQECGHVAENLLARGELAEGHRWIIVGRDGSRARWSR